MPNPVWPVTLPQDVLIAGAAFRRQAQAQHIKPDDGPSISVRRFTAYSEFAVVNILLTAAQWGIVQTFYDDTLAGGTLKFDWIHPITQAAREVKFDLSVEDHLAVKEALNHDLFLVTLALEYLP